MPKLFEKIPYALRWNPNDFQWYRYPISKDRTFLIAGAKEIVRFVDLIKYPNAENNRKIWLKHKDARAKLKSVNAQRVLAERLACDFEWSSNYRAIREGETCLVCHKTIKIDGNNSKFQYPVFLRTTKQPYVFMCEVCGSKSSPQIKIYGERPRRNPKTKRPYTRSELMRERIDSALIKFGYKSRARNLL